MTTLSCTDLGRALGRASAYVRDSQDELCALDAAAGDGDLGTTLANGLGAVVDGLPDPATCDDCGKLMTGAGMTLIRTAPSTIGTLRGSGFLRAGQEATGKARVNAAELAELLRTIATAVATRGGASVGQRTVLDALEPVAASAEGEAAAGSSPVEVVRAAAQAVRTGALATAGMEPVHGRASWIGERAVGRPDAGAAAWATILEEVADGVGAAGTSGLDR